MPVFGTAAVTFDPVGEPDRVDRPTATPQTAYAVPLGPLRILDAKTGKARTLVGRTSSASGGRPTARRSRRFAWARPWRARPRRGRERGRIAIRAGDRHPAPVRGRRLGRDPIAAVVDPGQLFIDQFLLYFDQYALSHHLWSPDSSSFLMPVVDRDGTTKVAVLFANDAPRR